MFISYYISIYNLLLLILWFIYKYFHVSSEILYKKMIPNYYEDVVEFNLPIDIEELGKVNYNWRQYNPRKNIRRYGCSITSLHGEDDGPDLDSLLQLGKYKETDFCTPTIHAKPFTWFLENIDVGRSHYLKIPAQSRNRGGVCPAPVGKLVELACTKILPGYTRRFFGGRQPLCGIGVMSLIL